MALRGGALRTEGTKEPSARPGGPAPAERSAGGATLLARRDLLGLAGLAALASALCVGLALGLRALWPQRSERRGLEIEAGRADELGVGRLDDRLAGEHGIWLGRTDEGIYALSARCTHLGCRVRPAAEGSGFRCACHGSHFSASGEVLRGPATRALERLGIRLGPSGALLVDPEVVFRKERGEWERPGALLRLRRGAAAPGAGRPLGEGPG